MSIGVFSLRIGPTHYAFSVDGSSPQIGLRISARMRDFIIAAQS